MRTADTILNIILDRGKRKLPLDDVYRQLYNPDFYLRSYAKMYKNAGAMTPGTTGETVDGMSLGKIDRVTCHQRFLPWFLESWRRHSCTFWRSEEHTSELQSLAYLVCRL